MSWRLELFDWRTRPAGYDGRIMAADYSRIHRLLKILTLIQGSKRWTPARLALECQTTERTIYRDLKMLEGAGIPYFFDRETNGYSIRRDFFMPPIQLTLEESLALALLAEGVGGREQVPFMKAAGRAISKIRGQLPAKIRGELQEMEDHIAIKLSAATPPESSVDVYETMQSALARRQSLKCQYDSLSGSQDGNAFVLKPYTLLFNQRAWYVVGHHSRYDDVRCLKLNRFTAIEQTDQPYIIPANFSLDRHLGNAWRIIRGKKNYSVELHFDAAFADTIAETQWHATQEVTWNDDNSITFTCQVDGLEEIVWWVLSMGPHCNVKKPKELIDQVRTLAAGIVAHYGTGANA